MNIEFSRMKDVGKYRAMAAVEVDTELGPLSVNGYLVIFDREGGAFCVRPPTVKDRDKLSVARWADDLAASDVEHAILHQYHQFILEHQRDFPNTYAQIKSLAYNGKRRYDRFVDKAVVHKLLYYTHKLQLDLLAEDTKMEYHHYELLDHGTVRAKAYIKLDTPLGRIVVQDIRIKKYYNKFYVYMPAIRLQTGGAVLYFRYEDKRMQERLELFLIQELYRYVSMHIDDFPNTYAALQKYILRAKQDFTREPVLLPLARATVE